MKPHLYLTLIGFLVFIASAFSANETARDVVNKADTKFKGEKSSYSEMAMTIVRPKYKRSLKFKSWSEGTEKSLTLITAPAREKGQTFLKNKNNLWSWNPTIQRLIKLPPSMMSQGWMGSDYSNDDIMRESSFVKDYNHAFMASETVDSYDCYVVELKPKPEADVIWGKIIMWISKNDYLMLKSEYYDEEEYLVKTHLGYDVKSFDGRLLPSKMEIIPADEDGNKTIVEILSMDFNIDIEENFFSQQNMKRIR